MAKDNKRIKRGEAVLKKMGRQGLLDNLKKTSPEHYEITTGHLFGDIWTRPHLSLRDRQLVTLATNIALARTTGNHSHFHSAMHLGITRDEIMELIIHVGHYAGWPTMGLAVRQFKRVIAAAEKAGKKKTPKELSELWEDR